MATTMWQDTHSGLRRHKLMTKELGETIPALGRQRGRRGLRRRARTWPSCSAPYTGWTWYITEWDAGDRPECFGLVQGFETELGYFSTLTELAEATVFGGVPAVERDLYWEPKALGEIRRSG